MTEAEIRGRLLGVALGAAPADLLAVGGDVVNVYTGEVVRWDVAVADGRVAAVGPDLASLAGPATERLDVRGKVLVPGFLDGHTHLDVLVTLPALLREAIPRGLTALVTEMVQVTSALGVPGARWFLDTLRVRPIHAYATAPVISYLSAEAGPGQPLLDAEALGALLEDPGETVTGALRDLGAQLARPLLTLQTLTFSAIPALRLTTRGLLAVKSREHVPALL